MPTPLCRIHIPGWADFSEVLCFGSHNTCLAIYVEPDLSVSEPPNPFPSACPFVFPQKFKHLRFLSGARRCQSTLWGFHKSAAALLRDPFSPSNPNNTDRDTLTSESEDRAGSHMHVGVCVHAYVLTCVCVRPDMRHRHCSTQTGMWPRRWRPLSRLSRNHFKGSRVNREVKSRRLRSTRHFSPPLVFSPFSTILIVLSACFLLFPLTSSFFGGVRDYFEVFMANKFYFFHDT